MSQARTLSANSESLSLREPDRARESQRESERVRGSQREPESKPERASVSQREPIIESTNLLLFYIKLISQAGIK